MKKLTTILTIFVFAALLPSFGVSAEDVPQQPQQPEVSTAYILIEASTGKVLSESNADVRLPPASLTKIMVLLLVAEEINAGRLCLTDTVTASANAAASTGSVIWLEQGERMNVADLVKATVISSANDAAVALGEHIAGNEQEFVALMNRRAHTLGMNNTTFANATGLDLHGHFTTARDVATMSRALMREENYAIFSEYMLTRLCSVRTGTARETQLLNTNKLITYYRGIEGIKTGTTDNAGYCLAAAAVRDDLRLISVVMGYADEDERLERTESLLDYGFAEYEIHRPDTGAQFAELRLPVVRGIAQNVAVMEQNPPVIVIPRGREGAIKYEIYLPEEVTAPIQANQPVGTITATLDGEVLYEGYIMAADDVAEMTFWRVLGFLVRSFLGI
jgi:D-alanyl-D-alanine carboxypeptidase (penicillin-binding protein 5/6)